MVKLAPKGHVVAKMVSSNKFQLKQDTIESGPSSAAADTVSTGYGVDCVRYAPALGSHFIIITSYSFLVPCHRINSLPSLSSLHLILYSCPVLSCPVLSCPVLSCPVLSCPVLL